MSIEDVNKALTGGGGRSAKFETKGDTVKGIISDASWVQQTDFKTGAPLTWADGNPRMQAVIILETEEHADDDDDGLRRVYAKGQMLQELRKAVGRVGIEIGGKLAVKFNDENPPKTRNESPQKLYQVWYQAPVRAAVDIGGGDMENPF